MLGPDPKCTGVARRFGRSYRSCELGIHARLGIYPRFLVGDQPTRRRLQEARTADSYCKPVHIMKPRSTRPSHHWRRTGRALVAFAISLRLVPRDPGGPYEYQLSR